MYHGDFDGPLERVIASLQAELNAGWEGIESEYDSDYNGSRYIEYYIYKHREETDKEYEKRMKQLEEEKEKAKEQKLKRLKKDLASLSDADRKLLGL